MDPLLIAIIGAAAIGLAVSRARRRPPSGPPRRRSAPTRTRRPATPTGDYPGDFAGRVDVRYDPRPDGRPDPGEIVWTWVPFEEDHTRGKDRPVLIIGRDGRWLLCLQLTSKDHDLDAAQEARWGRHWLDIGTGDWDPRRRPSEVRLDRIVRVDPAAVRREGAVLARRRFAEVARSLSEVHHW